MIRFYFDRVLPFVSLFGVFGYFLFDGFFTSTTWKTVHLVICVLASVSDLIFRLSIGGFSRKERSRIVASGLGIGSLLTYMIRDWLDIPPQAGIPQEITVIPRIREFLLVITVVFSIVFLAYTVLLEIGRRSLEVQSQLSDKKKGLLQNTIFSFLMFLPILVAVNYLAVMRNYNFDLSSSGKFSLSGISKNLLKDLHQNLEILAFYPRPLEADGPKESSPGATLALSRIRPDLEILLDQYKAANPKIQVRFINADVETDLLKGIGQVSNGTILIRSPRKATPGDPSSYNEERITVREKEDLEDLERKITAAILNVTTPKRKAYFTTSHGERYGVAFRNLRNEQVTEFTNSLFYLNFQINELGFAEGWPKAIPEDADLLLILGPTIPISEEGRKLVLDFIFKRKGKVFITAEPKGKEDFKWLLEKAGIQYSGIFLSQENTRPNLIVAKKFPDHPITDFIPRKEIGVVYPFGGSMDTFSDGSTQFTFLNTFILESGMGAFQDPQGTGKLINREDSKNFKLGVVLQALDPSGAGTDSVGSEKDPEKEGRVVFFAGTSWITDQFIPYNMNKNLALASVSWLFQKNIINEIPKRKDEVDVISLTDNQKIIVWLVGMFLFPGTIIGVGSYYVMSQRRKGDAEE